MEQTSKRLVLALCSISGFIDYLGYGVIVPLLPIYATTMGANEVDLTLIFSAYAIVHLITALPFGFLSDRYGRRPFIISGILLLSTSFALFPLAESIPALIAFRAIQGLAASLMWSSLSALVADVYTGERGEKIGLFNAFAASGSIVGPAFGGALAEVSFSLPFLVVAAASLTLGCCMTFKLKTPMVRMPSAPPLSAIRKVLSIRNVLFLLVAEAVISSLYGAMEPLLPSYLSGRLAMSIAEIGLAISISSLAFTVLQPIIGRLSDRYGRRKFIIPGFITLAASTALIPATGNSIQVYLVLCLTGATSAVAFTPITPLILDSLDEASLKNYGLTSSMFGIAWSSGYSTAPVTGGLVATYLGISKLFLFQAAALAMVGLLSAKLLHEPKYHYDNISL
ncbi:MAG: MFS transporter [Candidatus Freyarchaeota archaeon]|nr:MFS transporter [Candidatus Jordarchaeia archaeon]